MRENYYRFALFVLILAVLLMVAVEVVGSSPVLVSVYPKTLVCIPQRRETIRITTTIEKHKDNRHLSTSWSSNTGQSGLSLVELEGVDSPAIFTLYREINCASYTVQSCVYRTEKKFCDSEEVTVSGGDK